MLIDVAVSGESAGEFGLDAAADRHRFLMDEPEAMGGADRGPTPAQYLLATVLGCVNITLRIIAAERGIRIEELAGTVHGSLDPDRFLGKVVEGPAGFVKVRLNLTVRSNASEAELQDILELALVRCPITASLDPHLVLTADLAVRPLPAAN